MFLTFELTVVALVAGGYIGYIQLDFSYLVLNEINSPTLLHSKLVKVLRTAFAFHEGLIMVLSLRFLCIPVLFQAFSRLCLLRIMSTKSISKLRIRLYTEIKTVSAIMIKFEVLAYGSLLVVVFVYVLVGTGAMYIGIQKNHVAMAMPAFVVACSGLAFIQIIFQFGCSYYKFSMRIKYNWGNEQNVNIESKMSKAFLSRLIKSLQPVSLPAGNVGIIDKDIKMNYMDNVLQNVVSMVLTLKDVLN